MMAYTSPPDTHGPGRTPFTSQTLSSSSMHPPTSNQSQPTNSAPTTGVTMPAELEQTLALMTSHRSVLGYLLITRGVHPRMIRHSGIVFEGEQGKKYAAVIARIVETVQAGLEEIQGEDAVGETDDADLDEIRFMRIRTKKHEIMISPDDRYLLAVLHDPGT